MTAPDTHNPWQVVVSIWRSFLATFYRMPLLVLGSFLLYTLVSGYWQHYSPFHTPRGLASQSGYELLHAVIFAPLILAVIQMIARQSIRYADIWTVAAISVGAVIALNEFGILLINSLMRLVKSGINEGLIFNPSAQNTAKFVLIYRLYAVIGIGQLLGVFLLSMRMALLLPIIALEKIGWRAALLKAWRDMRGNFGFALAVGCAALLPLLVADHFLAQLYRIFYTSNALPVPLSPREWEALMVRSAQLTLGYIATAALVAWLYRAIAGRRATAPSL